jgi:hypothetical protein
MATVLGCHEALFTSDRVIFGMKLLCLAPRYFAFTKFGVDPTVLIVQARIDFFATEMLRLPLRPVRSERLLFCRMQTPVRKELGVC